jgi:hypothetical protein
MIRKFENFVAKTYPCNLDGIAIRVHRQRNQRGVPVLIARAIDADTGHRIPNISCVRHKIRSLRQWENEAQNLVGLLESKLQPLRARGSAHIPHATQNE